MITTAFFNNKGGVGKSTAAINVAHALTKLNKRVLVVDCDSQRNSFDFFSDKDNVYTNSKENPTRYENLDIKAGVYQRTNSKGDKSELAVSGNYDYVLLDMPSTLDKEVERTLSLCDFIFVPIELGQFSISGIAKVTEAIATTGAKLGGCFVSKFDHKNPADHELDELLRSTGIKALTTLIPCSRVIKNSISYRQTALEYMGWTEAAKSYMTLTREIMKICEG